MASVTNAQLFSLIDDGSLSDLIFTLENLSGHLDTAFDIIALCAPGQDIKPEDSPYGQALSKLRSEIGTLMLKDLIWERYKRKGF